MADAGAQFGLVRTVGALPSGEESSSKDTLLSLSRHFPCDLLARAGEFVQN